MALLGAVLLGGCEGLNPEWDPQPIEASQSVIGFEHGDFDATRAKYLLQHDPRSANDIYLAQLVGDDTFATLAAYKTGPGFVIGERRIESYVEDLLQDVEVTWGESGRASTRLGSVPYRMFRIEGRPLDCVGFGQTRGESNDDRGRKNDLIFGFFCRSDARPLSSATATDLIGQVSLAGRR